MSENDPDKLLNKQAVGKIAGKILLTLDSADRLLNNRPPDNKPRLLVILFHSRYTCISFSKEIDCCQLDS